LYSEQTLGSKKKLSMMFKEGIFIFYSGIFAIIIKVEEHFSICTNIE